MIHKLTREEALKYHRQMWSDMQKELGDEPSCCERADFKYDWCKKHFPNEYVVNACFLCEYVSQNNTGTLASCVDKCLIDWTDSAGINTGCIGNRGIIYSKSPISVILALPERKEEGK